MTKELPQELEWLADAQRDLTEAKTVQDFKSIRDKAEEAQYYLKRHGFPMELRIYAAEIRVIAARRAGEAIAKLQPRPGRPRKATKKRFPVETNLSELGISKIDSHRWQRIARIPAEEFLEYLAKCRQSGREATREGLLELEQRLRRGGAASEPPKARGGKAKRAAQRRARDAEPHKPVEEKDLRDSKTEFLTSKDIPRHREKLKELLVEMSGNEPLPPATLRYIEQLSRELREYEERQLPGRR